MNSYQIPAIWSQNRPIPASRRLSVSISIKAPRKRRVPITFDSDLIDLLIEIAIATAKADDFPSYNEWCATNAAAIKAEMTAKSRSGIVPNYPYTSRTLYKQARGPATAGRPSFHNQLSAMIDEGMRAWLESKGHTVTQESPRAKNQATDRAKNKATNRAKKKVF